MDLKKEEIRSSVHPIKGMNHHDLYSKISKVLGDGNPFSEMKIGHNFRTWTDNRCTWHPLSEATYQDTVEIDNALDEARTKLSQVADEKTIKALFTIPDENYVFFNNDDGKMHVVLAAWGFAKSAKDGSTGVEVGKVKLKDLVKDGPEKDRYVKPIVSVETKSKEDIDEGKKDDPVVVTDKGAFECDILVTVKENGEPKIGKTVNISYDKIIFNGITDENGQFKQHVTIVEGSQCIVSVEEYESQTRDSMQKDETAEFVFDREVVEPPVVPPPPVRQISVTVLDNNGKPLNGAFLRLTQDGKDYIEKQLDENGSMTFDEGLLETAKNTSALITGLPNEYPPILFTLDDGEYEYVLQEEKAKTQWWVIPAEIVTVLGTAIVARFLIWPIFENIALGLYNGFYN